MISLFVVNVPCAHEIQKKILPIYNISFFSCPVARARDIDDKLETVKLFLCNDLQQIRILSEFFDW